MEIIESVYYFERRLQYNHKCGGVVMEDSVVQEKRSYKVLKDQRQYLKLIGSNIINRFGDSLDAIAFSWIVYEITQSASLMALIIAINYIPTMILQPIAGVIVDRIPKKRIMVLCDIGRGLVVLSVALLYMWDLITPLYLAITTVLNSTLEAFRVPAGLAIVPKLLDRDKYTVGTALNSTLGRICEIIGLASAGSIIALVKSYGALIIDAATFLLSALIISAIKIQEHKSEIKQNFESVKKGFVEGLHYLRSNHLLIIIIFLGMFMNFAMVPLNALSTAYVVDNLHSGPEMLSAIQLALVAGMALGSFITPKIDVLGRKKLFIGGGVIVSIIVSALWQIPNIPGIILRLAVMISLLVIMGIGVGVQNVIFSAAFMRHIDKDLMGRLGGITNAILVAAMPLGALLSSIAAKIAPVPVIFLISGVFSIILYFVMMRIRILKEL
jgi:DHA3 family macrolide efflux protein-like MFS transporter